MSTPANTKTWRSIGIAYLAIGGTFFVLSLTGQSAFLAIGLSFMSLGLVFLAKTWSKKP